MNEIVLSGCTTTPLANYLKSLGVLRILNNASSETFAIWRDDIFVIKTPLDQKELEDYLLLSYQPTPVLAPWNGGSGFYFQERKSIEKDPSTGKRTKLGIRDQPTEATRTIETISGSTNEQLGAYRDVIKQCQDLIKQFGLEKAPEGKLKDHFILSLRNTLPEDYLEWIDASLMITSEVVKFPPLLGSGGNDGNLEFTNNFMQRLCDVLNLEGGEPADDSTKWLRAALHGEPVPGLIKKAVGQFSPGQVGGPNATEGFEAASTVNPWDFVLMIEGALPFAAATARRCADDPKGDWSYPFTVRAVSAGAGSLGEGDAASARGELWMPVWRKFATYEEIRSLLAEGRIAFGRKPARDALDFVRAVHQLGCSRGINAFQRYGLLKRSGKAYLATPLARVEVNQNQKVELIDELDQHDWLTRFRRFTKGENVAKRFPVLRKQLEDAIFEFASHTPVPAETQAFLSMLGTIQRTLGLSQKTQESVPPVPHLSERWVQAADDGTPAFRIARALAGLSGTKDAPSPLRAQLFPLHPRFNQWMVTARKAKTAANDPACRIRIHTETKSNLPDILIALLNRRLWLAEQFDMPDKPLRSPAGIDLDDLLAFLHSDHMDQHIAGLLFGLSLCSIPQDTEYAAGKGVAPAAFAVLKLCLTPDATLRGLNLLGEKDNLPVPPGLLAQLAADTTGNRAIRLAWRRLRASGLSPLFAPDALPELGGIDHHRAAAALLIPLRFGATGMLGRVALNSPESETLIKTAAH